jgi:hypothetical protein
VRSPDTAWLPIRLWDRDARRMARRTLRRYGASWSAPAMARRARASMVEIQKEGMHVRAGGRQVMQHAGEEEHHAPWYDQYRSGAMPHDPEGPGAALAEGLLGRARLRSAHLR